MVANWEYYEATGDPIVPLSVEELTRLLQRHNIDWEGIARRFRARLLLEEANRFYKSGLDSRAERRAARDREILAYREAGLKLIEAEERIAAGNRGSSYGKWLPYLREYAPDIRPRRAQRLQELARVEYDVNSDDTSLLIAEWRRINGNAERTGAVTNPWRVQEKITPPDVPDDGLRLLPLSPVPAETAEQFTSLINDLGAVLGVESPLELVMTALEALHAIKCGGCHDN